MKKLLPLTLTLLALLAACGGGNRNTVVEVADPVEETDFFVLDFEDSFDKAPRAATFNELIDTIRYIPLQTHPDGLLPARYDMVKIDGDFFVGGGIAVPVEAPIYRFDSLGQFVEQVTYHGRGPNEVLITMGWHANRNLKQINVVSVGAKMVVHPVESGERYEIGIVESQGFDRIPLNDSTFVSSRSAQYNDELPKASLFFIDRNGNTVHSIERTGEKADYTYRLREGSWAGPYEDYKLFPNYKGDAIFHDIFNDTLYRVKSRSEITPHLVIRRGALFPDRSDVGDQNSRQKRVYFAYVEESGDHVFLNYHYGGKVWSDVWSKRDGSLMLRHAKVRPGVPAEIFVPYSLPDGSLIELQMVYADQEHVYCLLEALDACRFMPGVKEDDNPVIVVAKLKQ